KASATRRRVAAEAGKPRPRGSSLRYGVSRSYRLRDEVRDPHVGEELLQPVETLVAEDGAPFSLDLGEDLVFLGPGGVAALGEVDDAGAAVRLIGRALNVAELLEALEKLVHGLLAHTGPLGQLARTAAVGAGILE